MSRGFDSANIKKFSGATAISSAAYFGNKEEEHGDEIDYYQGMCRTLYYCVTVE